MSKTEFVAAVDIGTTKVVALVGQKEMNGKVNILGLGEAPSKGIKRGVIINIEEAVSSIDMAVKQAQEASQVKVSDVFVGVSGQFVKCIKRRSHIDTFAYHDEISQKDVDALINDMYKISIAPSEEIIHVLPQDFVVDNEAGVMNPVGMSAKKLGANYQIIIGQSSTANNIRKCIKRAGLNTRALMLNPLASSESVLSRDEKKLGVVLVDIGGGTTDISVYYEDVLHHTAIIPFAGNAVTNDIKEGCHILGRVAEALKVQYGSAVASNDQNLKYVVTPGLKGREPKEISLRNLSSIIQARMEEIIEAVVYEIEASGVADKLGAGIVLTGGGALLRNLHNLFSYKTGMDVRLGYPNELLNNDHEDEINQPIYSTAVGLILMGFDQNEQLDQEEEEEEVVVVEQEPEKVKEQKVKKSGSKKSIFTKMAGLFDEIDDAEMN